MGNGRVADRPCEFLTTVPGDLSAGLRSVSGGRLRSARPARGFVSGCVALVLLCLAPAPARAQGPVLVSDVASAERAVARADAEGGEALHLALSALATAHFATGDLQATETVVARALRVSDALYGPDDPRSLRILADETTVLRLIGMDALPRLAALIPRLAAADPTALADRGAYVAATIEAYVATVGPPDAVALMRRAVAFSVAAGDPALADHRSYLAFLLLKENRLDEAGDVLSRVPEDRPFFVKHVLDLATRHWLAGDTDAAARWLTRLLVLPPELLGERAPDIAETGRNVGSRLLVAGRHADAEAMLDEVLALQRKVLPADDPRTAETLGVLGQLAFLDDRYDAAETALREAIRIFGIAQEGQQAGLRLALDDLGFILVQERRFADAEPVLRRELELARAAGEPDPTVVARLGLAALELDRVAEARTLLAGALAAWPEVSPEEAPGGLGYDRDLAQLRNNLGRAEARAGRAAAAEAQYRAALALLDQAPASAAGTVARDRSSILGNLADALVGQGRLDEAEAAALEALSLKTGHAVAAGDVAAVLAELSADAATAPRGEILSRLKDVGTLLQIAQARGPRPELVAPMRGIVSLRETLLPADDADLARARTNLAMLLFELGRPDEAIDWNRRALDGYGRGGGVLGAALRTNLAVSLREAGRVEAVREAVELAGEAQGMLEEAMGTDAPAALEALTDLGVLYNDLGRTGEADTLLSRVVRAREGQGQGQGQGTGGADLARSLGNLASVRIAQGKAAEAEALCRRGLALTDGVLPDGHPDRVTLLGNLAFALGLQNRREEALPLQRRSLALQRRRLPPGHPALAQELNALAATLARLDRLGEAEDAAAEAMTILERTADPDGPDMASALAMRGILALMREAALPPGEGPRRAELLSRALADLRRASAGTRRPGQGELPWARDRLPFYVYAAMRMARSAQGEERRALLAEAFEAAQGIKRLSASRSVVAAGARWAAQDDALAGLVRRHQDVLAAIEGARKAVSDTFAGAAGQAGAEAARRRLRDRLRDLEDEAATLSAEISRRYPRYAAVSAPAPLGLQEAQALLGPDEALVLFASSDLSRALPGATGSTVLAVTRDTIVAEPLPVEEDLARSVAALRCAAALTDPACAGLRQPGMGAGDMAPGDMAPGDMAAATWHQGSRRRGARRAPGSPRAAPWG